LAFNTLHFSISM